MCTVKTSESDNFISRNSILYKAVIALHILEKAGVIEMNITDLEGADLTGADLTGADLSGANLKNIDPANLDLSGEKNNQTKGNVK